MNKHTEDTIMKHSLVLNQSIVFNNKSQTVTAADGTVYNKQELNELRGQSPEMIKAVHAIKRKFKGVVV